MKTSTMEKAFRMMPYVCALAGALIGARALAGCGFDGGLGSDNLGEGDRCNPYLYHNDCSSGAVCAGAAPSMVSIPFCPENYCCTVDSTMTIKSGNPYCQPGCAGGAAAICAATADPTTCIFADSGIVPPADAGGQ